MGLRRAAFALTLLAIAGCAYDEGNDLPPVVAAATPPDARPLVPCGGSPGLIEAPSYACAFLAPGDGPRVTSYIEDRLRAAEFAVACPEPHRLYGARGNVAVLAEVTERGTFLRHGDVVNAFDEGYIPVGAEPIPRGSVFVRLAALRVTESDASHWRGQASGDGQCGRAFEREPALRDCETWWNAPAGERARREAERRRLGPDVHVTGSDRPGVSTCTYTIRTRRSFLRTTTRFDQGTWSSTPLVPVRPRGPFRPNARLSAGWLTLTAED